MAEVAFSWALESGKSLLSKENSWHKRWAQEVDDGCVCVCV